MIFSLHKKKLEDKKNPFDLLIDLWEDCKKNNEVPTQIIIGSGVYKYLIKDQKWKKYFYPIQATQFQQLGLVGKIGEIDVLTDFYIENEEQLGWSIDEDEVVFNIGNKLVGKL